MNKPNVAIIMGSDSARDIMKPAVDMLDKSGVSYKDQEAMVRSKKRPAE